MIGRRTRLALVGAGLAVALGAGGLAAWRALPYVPPAAAAARPASVRAELAYVQRYWQHRNTATYGDLGGTDCVDFTSQALHARGWPMTAAWGHSRTLGRDAYTAAWISSTAFARWLGDHPALAEPLTDAQRGRVRVGDVVQFDWDASGDRDHTGIVSRLVHHGDGTVEVDVAQHSPSGLTASADALIAQHGGHGRILFWHLLT